MVKPSTSCEWYSAGEGIWTPVIFITYFSDLLNGLQHSETSLYAKGSKFFKVILTQDECEKS